MDSDAGPPLEGSGTASPWLLWSEAGDHGCVGCGRCETVCPAAALRVEVGHVADDEIEVRRFELEPGRCMGCGLCRRACPEEALMMAEGGSRVDVGAAPIRLCLVDLLRRTA